MNAVFSHPLRALSLCAIVTLLLASCERGAFPPAELDELPEENAVTEFSEMSDAPTSSCAPLEELAAMDPRQSVPLQPMMAWHQSRI